MDNLLSIVVLSYKNGEMLLETIDSILNQDYPAIEIIICDDASPDFDSLKVEQYIESNKKDNIKNTVILVNELNLGTVKNLNRGIYKTSGTFIKAIAGDDCIYSTDVFSYQVNYLMAHPEEQFVVGNSVECDETMQPIRETGFLLAAENELFHDYEMLLKYVCRTNQNALATQAICFRKSFFETIGMYDENFTLIEDLPMAVRIVTNHLPFGYVNYPCVKHRGKGGVSTSNNAFDIKRITYYEDLEKYFSLCLVPLKRIIGPIYVPMRQKVAAFRVEYCRLKPLSGAMKLKLYIKYAIPLLYYIFTKTRRVLFYLKNEG